MDYQNTIPFKLSMLGRRVAFHSKQAGMFLVKSGAPYTAYPPGTDWVLPKGRKGKLKQDHVFEKPELVQHTLEPAAQRALKTQHPGRFYAFVANGPEFGRWSGSVLVFDDKDVKYG